MPQIPEPSGKAPELEVLRTESVAEIPQTTESPEAIPFRISFATYSETECQVHGMRKPNAATALKVIRDVGVNLTDSTTISGTSRFIDEIKLIRDEGAYRVLYRRLPEDTQIREIKYVRENRRDEDRNIDIRIFFYTLDTERTFYIVAIRESHYDTDKSGN